MSKRGGTATATTNTTVTQPNHNTTLNNGITNTNWSGNRNKITSPPSSGCCQQQEQ